MFRWFFFFFALWGLFGAVCCLADDKEPPQPIRRTLAHWVRLVDGSLLVGRIEKIDADSLVFDLRLGPKSILTIPRKNIALLVVIPPVDPALNCQFDRLEPIDKSETARLLNGDVLTGKLRRFANGVFQFDVSIGDELFTESLQIPAGRVRTISLQLESEMSPLRKKIFLSNGTEVLDFAVKNGTNGVITLTSPWISAVNLEQSALFSLPGQILPDRSGKTGRS